MNEEEKKAIGWLSALDIKSEFEATNKEIILNLIEKQDKMINVMADYMATGKSYYGGKQEILKVFERKVEDGGTKN